MSLARQANEKQQRKSLRESISMPSIHEKCDFYIPPFAGTASHTPQQCSSPLPSKSKEIASPNVQLSQRGLQKNLAKHLDSNVFCLGQINDGSSTKAAPARRLRSLKSRSKSPEETVSEPASLSTTLFGWASFAASTAWTPVAVVAAGIGTFLPRMESDDDDFGGVISDDD